MISVHGVNPSDNFMGCPWHFANTTSTAANSFRSETDFDVEDFLVDIFDESSKERIYIKNIAVLVIEYE